MSSVITAVLERFWTLGVIDAPNSGEVTLAWSDLLAPCEKEIRIVAELEPLPEPKKQNPDEKLNEKEPLTDDDPSANPNASDTSQQGRCDTVSQTS